jgi:hypothetical protein
LIEVQVRLFPVIDVTASPPLDARPWCAMKQRINPDDGGVHDELENELALTPVS